MEEVQRSKRRRVYSFEPNAVVYTNFSQKYVGYLLPALLQATAVGSYHGDEDNEIEKKVRFEVDMALVFSAGGFRWSRALKHKLEQDTNWKHCRFTTQGFLLIGKHSKHFGIVKELNQLPTWATSIPRSLVPVVATSPKRLSGSRSCKITRGEEELGCRVRILRRILPGGSEMSMCELLSEVESYVVCLQMQVTILRSLVAAQ